MNIVNPTALSAPPNPWPFGQLTATQQRAHRAQQQHLRALAEAAHRARVEAAVQAWARRTTTEVRP